MSKNKETEAEIDAETEAESGAKPEPVVQKGPRREARATVDWKVAVEKLGERGQKLPPALEAVYERVHTDGSDVGKRAQLTIRDVSMNGAFLEGEPLPLLSRVAMVFAVPGFRKVEAVGWVMWRRKEPCTVEHEGKKLELPAGFGVLFEWMSLESRLEIARRIARDISG
jgi:hypothetical protein